MRGCFSFLDFMGFWWRKEVVRMFRGVFNGLLSLFFGSSWNLFF